MTDHRPPPPAPRAVLVLDPPPTQIIRRRIGWGGQILMAGIGALLVVMALAVTVAMVVDVASGKATGNLRDGVTVGTTASGAATLQTCRAEPNPASPDGVEIIAYPPGVTPTAPGVTVACP